MSEAQIREEFAGSESMGSRSERTTSGQDDALLDIYRKLRPVSRRPARPPRAAARQPLLQPEALRPGQGRSLQDRPQARSRRRPPRLGAHARGHRRDDQVPSPSTGATGRSPGSGGEAVELTVETDDIDHFGNRRLRSVGELIQNQVRTGLSRMERVVRERMTTQDVEAITPQTLINIRPVVASIKEFFGTSQLAVHGSEQPAAGLTHKRRLSALGPGGLSRDRAGMEVRDVHPSITAACARSRPRKVPTSASSVRSRHTRDQPVRVHRDALPQGRGRHGQRRHPPSVRRRGGPPSSPRANAALDGRRLVRRGPRPGPDQGGDAIDTSQPTRSTTWTFRRARWSRPRPR